MLKFDSKALVYDQCNGMRTKIPPYSRSLLAMKKLRPGE